MATAQRRETDAMALQAPSLTTFERAGAIPRDRSLGERGAARAALIAGPRRTPDACDRRPRRARIPTDTTRAALSVAARTMPRLPKAAERFDVEMHQIAGLGPLVALRRDGQGRGRPMQAQAA